MCNMDFENEKPLENLVADGGFTGIFRTIGCIGDSLASGEVESTKEDGTTGYHDMYEYSWGQYMARAAGNTVYNFSCGGMTAKWYLDSFGNDIGAWDRKKACQAYIFALGVNDILNQNTSFARTTGSGYTQNSWNSCIGRYFSVQFVYNLRHFGKKGSTKMSDYNYKESSGSVGVNRGTSSGGWYGPRR